MSNHTHRSFVAMTLVVAVTWLSGSPLLASGDCPLTPAGGGSSGWLQVDFFESHADGACAMDPETEICVQARGCAMQVTMIAECIFSTACGGAPTISVTNGDAPPVDAPPDENGKAKLRLESFSIDCGKAIQFKATAPDGSRWTRSFECGPCPTVLPPLE